MRKRKGFTLMELIIVVIIIAILAAIGLPQFFRAAGKAKEARAKSNLGHIRKVELAIESTRGTFQTFGLTQTVNLTADIDTDGINDIEINFFDNDYRYSVVGVVATAAPLVAVGTSGLFTYTMNLRTGQTGGTGTW